MLVRVCHPFGNPNSYNAAVALYESGHLQSFHTYLYRPLGLMRRYHSELPAAVVSKHNWPELLRLAVAPLPLLGKWGRSPWAIDHAVRAFDRQTAGRLTGAEGAVYCYEDSAQTTFERAGQLGLARIYELPITYHRAKREILQQELSRYPEVAEFAMALTEPAEKEARKDEELKMAEIVVCPSDAVRDSVQNRLPVTAKFLTLPYGCDTTVNPKVWSEADFDGPLRIIFAGTLGPRKGVHTLFEAISKVPARSVAPRLAGRWAPGFREWVTKRYPIRYEWLGQLPRNELYDALRDCHLFVFPSFAEGFPLAVLEALSVGLPVLASFEAVGSSVVSHGENGWVIPAGNAEALATALADAIKNRRQLPEMGKAARARAESLSWQVYRNTLRDGIHRLVGPRWIEQRRGG